MSSGATIIVNGKISNTKRFSLWLRMPLIVPFPDNVGNPANNCHAAKQKNHCREESSTCA